MGERLHKILARAGFGSRRRCEELVVQGRVSVDGELVRVLGTEVDPERQRICVDGEAIRLARPVYLVLNKPRGVLSSSGGTDRAPCAAEFVPPGLGRVFCVGRLDKESEGLLLLTNDGALTERLTHPRHEVPKTYRALVRGRISAETVDRLRRGVFLAEGKARATVVRVLRQGPPGSLLEIQLKEGKNRQIRRMLARVGHPVKRLVRTAIGPLKLGRLERGAVRSLKPEEIEALKQAAFGQETGKGPPRRRGRAGGENAFAEQASRRPLPPSRDGPAGWSDARRPAAAQNNAQAPPWVSEGNDATLIRRPVGGTTDGEE